MANYLVTEWPEYRKLNWAEIKSLLTNPLIVDGRNFLKREEPARLGYRYIGWAGEMQVSCSDRLPGRFAEALELEDLTSPPSPRLETERISMK